MPQISYFYGIYIFMTFTTIILLIFMHGTETIKSLLKSQMGTF